MPDLAAVICPPYDVIDRSERARLAAKDPRNAVHVELPTFDGAGRDTDAPYRRAGELLAAWQADGTLARDQRPAIYPYEQVFAGPGGALAAARGFFCRLRLEAPGPAASVRPHEHTLAAPKEDRFRLMKAARANLSPVLLMHRPRPAAADLLARLMSRPPDAQARADDGVSHRLWSADPTADADAAALLRLAGDGPLTIADGHHRYATALRFRDEVGGAGTDHVLALLYDAHGGGLVLEPTHRVVRGVADPEALIDLLGDRFEVQTVERSALRAALGRGGLAVWTRAGGAWLRPRPAALEVAVLSAALPELLGAAEPDLERSGRLWYTRDADQALASVDNGNADACFLLNATPVDTVIDHAARGEVMPPKSTYFRPKAATGLVFNLLDE